MAQSLALRLSVSARRCVQQQVKATNQARSVRMITTGIVISSGVAVTNCAEADKAHNRLHWVVGAAALALSVATVVSRSVTKSTLSTRETNCLPDGPPDEDHALLADEAYGAGNFSEARRLYAMAAAEGKPGTLCNLSMMIFNGEGGVANPVEARRVLEGAAGQGDVDAQLLLARMHTVGPNPNYEEARSLLQPLVDQNRANNAMAQAMLGKMVRAHSSIALRITLHRTLSPEWAPWPGTAHVGHATLRYHRHSLPTPTHCM